MIVKGFDPRAKLLMIILAAVYVTIDLSILLEISLILIFILPFFASNLPLIGSSFFVIYVIQLLGSLYLLPYVESPFFIYIVSFIFNGFRLLLPGIIAGTFAIKTTSVSEWVATFKTLRVPNWLLIPIAVMLRFFPAVREDYHHIRKAMAFRGIGTSALDLLKKPATTFEYILIPLLMNATQVAEDLTVSALTKGLSLPGKHTTIVQLKWKVSDWLLIIAALIPFILYIGGTVS